MSPETAWKATLGELELQMTKATFNTWLKDARLLACEDNEFVIGVRNDYAKDWLENRLQDTILRTLSAIVGQPINIRFVVWSDEIITPAPQVMTGNTAENSDSKPLRRQTNGNQSVESISLALNSRFTFASFVVGASNRLAHAAALSVAENPGQTYNPLFIYGGVGLGKTHLLHAIGHKCVSDGLTICYISSETFTNDLVQSIRNKQMAQFRERYRTPDILLIDDIQFIAGKESTQEELFHTFNDLHSQGKQVVLSSDRPPKAMATLEERLQSRFEWGLMADIQLPDTETRKAILQAKAEDHGVAVPDHVIDLIAHHVRNNIRELEGALNKVIAYAQLSGTGVVDSDLVNMALADLVRRPEKVTIPQVVEAVCAYYNVTEDALYSTSRSRTIAFPRQMAMYLARTETDSSLPYIGEHLGNRDHTTVLYGYEKIAALLETDATARRDMLEIKAALYEANGKQLSISSTL
ncbi:MAG: chromosomal replication initiator protein DnaA [Anaerolineales bacterium]|nr:chromosomal replication initiator protein DnaA [Anaerolineales bacterium]